MKKITCMAMMAAMLLLAVPANAQFCWGIKGGVSLGCLPDFETEDHTLKLDNYAGLFIGPKAEVRIPIIGLGVEVAAMYAQKNASSSFKQSSFQLPLNVKYSFGLGNKANLFLAVGPELGFNTGKTSEVYYMEKSTLDLNVGVGVTLLKHVQLAANYNMPWREKLYYKSGLVQFSLAYLF